MDVRLLHRHQARPLVDMGDLPRYAPLVDLERSPIARLVEGRVQKAGHGDVVGVTAHSPVVKRDRHLGAVGLEVAQDLRDRAGQLELVHAPVGHSEDAVGANAEGVAGRRELHPTPSAELVAGQRLRDADRPRLAAREHEDRHLGPGEGVLRDRPARAVALVVGVREHTEDTLVAFRTHSAHLVRRAFYRRAGEKSTPRAGLRSSGTPL